MTKMEQTQNAKKVQLALAREYGIERGTTGNLSVCNQHRLPAVS